jgi:chloride channel, nucleotide-sensitive, 1A
MQMDLLDGGSDDETFDTVDLTLVPPVPEADSDNPSSSSQSSSLSPTARLFNAISACADLHPDLPVSESADGDGDDDDRIVFEGEALEGFSGVYSGTSDGGLPPPMPGSGGWITADNLHEFFDAEGNWIGGEGGEGESESEDLGEGAGRVRGRAEVDADGINGHGAEDDGESKRPRTE